MPRRPDTRSLARRPVYLGEGLSLRILKGDLTLHGEVVDLTPDGAGVAVMGEPHFEPGEVVTLLHTGRVTGGLRQQAIVRHVGEGKFRGRTLARIGLSFLPERTEPGTTPERRATDRFDCTPRMPATASAVSPLFFREWLHFAIRQVSAGGMTMSTSIRNKGLLPGLELHFEVSLPLAGLHKIRGRITFVRREGREFMLGVAWRSPSKQFLAAIAEYILLGDKSLTPARLRKSGFPVASVERAVTYDYASGKKDYQEILELRLRAHQAENRLSDKTPADMASPFDTYARHLTCRFGKRIIGYVRLIFIEGDRSRSQYVEWGGHEVPEWLWKAGFLEAGAGATDPDFQRAGLFLPLMQHVARIAAQAGVRCVLGACDDELLNMYKQMGFELLESRDVEPRPGWKFRSHLIVLDLEKLDIEPPSGRSVDAMASAVDFVKL